MPSRHGLVGIIGGLFAAVIAILLVMPVVTQAQSSGVGPGASGRSGAELSAMSGAQYRDPGFLLEMERERQALLARVARRKQAGPRAERQRSRSRFRGLSRAEAVQLARTSFIQELQRPLEAGLRLGPGERLKGYFNDHMAKVTADSAPGAAIIQSLLPMRAEDERGDKRPVDLALTRDGDHLESVNPIAPVHYGDTADRALAFPASGVEIAPAGGNGGSQAIQRDNRVFYPEVVGDVDFVTVPTPTGAESSWIVRAASAPEEYKLQVTLPAGAELAYGAPAGGGLAQPLAARPIDVVKDGKVLGSLKTPVAKDADGESIPATMAFDGDRVTVRVAHQQADAAYPVLLDPVYEDYMRWTQYSSGGPGQEHNPGLGNAGWDWYANAGYPCFCNNPSAWGNGLYLVAPGGNYYNPGQWNQWTYRAPGDSYVWRADFGWISHDPEGLFYGTTQRGAAAFVAGIWGYRNGAGFWETARANDPAGNAGWHAPWMGTHGFDYAWQTHCQQPCYWGTPSNPAGTAGNLMLMGQTFTGTGYAWGQATAFMGGAQVGLHEFNPPYRTGELTHQRVSASGAVTAGVPTSWLSDGSLRTTLPVADGGLGMRSVSVHVAGNSPLRTTTLSCTGSLTNGGRCPTSTTQTLEYPISSLPEGNVLMDASARDAVDNGGTGLGSQWNVKVDRAAPTTSVGGGLKNLNGQWVRDDTYEIPVSATDAGAGVKKLTLSVDGDPVDSHSALTRTDSAPLSHTFSLDTEPLTYGSHEIKVTATDWLDKTSDVSWTILADGRQTTFTFDPGATLDEIEATGSAVDEVVALQDTRSVDASGGYRPDGELLSDALDNYRSMYREDEGPNSEPTIRKVTYGGSVPTAALGPLAAKVSAREELDLTTLPPPEGDGDDNSPVSELPYLDELFDADVAAEQQEIDTRDGDAGVSAADKSKFAPDYGSSHTFNVAGSSRPRRIHQTLTWTTNNWQEEFENTFNLDDAYEHDFKLINYGNSNGFFDKSPRCSSSESDDFWAVRSGKYWKATGKDVEDGGPYFDTNLSDRCVEMDFTIGFYFPRNLKTGRKYGSIVRAKAGQTSGSKYWVIGQRQTRDCPNRNPECVAPLGRGGDKHNFIYLNDAPECRRWRNGRRNRPC